MGLSRVEQAGSFGAPLSRRTIISMAEPTEAPAHAPYNLAGRYRRRPTIVPDGPERDVEAYGWMSIVALTLLGVFVVTLSVGGFMLLISWKLAVAFWSTAVACLVGAKTLGNSE